MDEVRLEAHGKHFSFDPYPSLTRTLRNSWISIELELTGSSLLALLADVK